MSRSVLALDIEDGRLAAAVVETGWGGGRLRSGFVWRLPEEARETEQIARFAADCVEEAGLFGDRVVLGLGGDRAYLRRIGFPFTSREKIEQALPFEMEPSLPLSREELIFDAHYLGKGSRGGSRVLAAALPRAEAEEWIRCLRDKGLDPARIDLHLSGLTGLGGYASARVSGPCTAVWHLGRTKSAIAVLRNGSLVQARSFRWGTEDLLRAPAEAPEGSPENREADGRDADAERGEGAGIDGCALAAQRELMRSIWAVQNESPEIEVQEILVTGPGADWEELWSALALRSEIRFFSVRDLSLPFFQPDFDPGPDLPLIAPAACLALSEGKRSSGWNFRKGDLAFRGGASRRKAMIHAGIGLGILLLCLAGAFTFHIRLKQQELHQIRDRTERVFRQAVPEASESLRPAQFESVLQNRIASLREEAESSPKSAAGMSPLELLRIVSQSAPKEEVFRLERLTMDSQGALVVGHAGSYDTVNRIRESMLSEEAVDAVQIQGVTANQGEDTVRFTLRLNAGS